MEFGFSKCVGITLKRRKVIMSKVVVMPDRKTIKCIEEGCSYKYLDILEVDGEIHKEMKEETRKKCIKCVRNILRSKLMMEI